MKPKTTPAIDMGVSGLSIIVAIAVMSAMWQNNLAVLIYAIAHISILIALWHEVEDILYFMAVFLIGTVGDIVCVASGAWTYNNPSSAGIPIWLPLLWGISAMSLRRGIVGLITLKSK